MIRIACRVLVIVFLIGLTLGLVLGYRAAEALAGIGAAVVVIRV